MTPTDEGERIPRRSRQGLAAGVIVVLALVTAVAAGWNNSATNDEPYHTLAAFAYVHGGHGDLNVEHPPLVKLLAGAALVPLHLRGTEAPPVRRLLALSTEVRRFLYFNRAPSETILRAARLPGLVFLALLLVGVYEWGRWALGPSAALLALLAVACQPLVLGHAFVVHTDVPAAAAWTWSLYLLHRWLAGWTAGWLPFGVAVGLALLVKFSAVYLVPLAAVAVLVVTLRRHRFGTLARFAAACAVAAAIVVAGMSVPLRNGNLAEERATISTTLGLWPATSDLSKNLQAVAAVSRPVAHYALGLAYVWQTNLHGQGINYFLGRTAVQGFTWYFPTALVLKTSLPFLALAVWGLIGVARRRIHADLYFLVVTAYYLAVSLDTSYNIGARHLMPMLPPLALLGAHHMASLARPFRLGLATCLVTSAVLAFPHYIAHFNLLVGGPQFGARYLNDSNLDWGQDWMRLARKATNRGWVPMAYVYLGAGFPGHDMPGAVDALDSATPPDEGFVAVSSYAATVGVRYLEALRYHDEAVRLAALLAAVRRRGVAVGEVGHTITVYQLMPMKDPK